MLFEKSARMHLYISKQNKQNSDLENNFIELTLIRLFMDIHFCYVAEKHYFCSNKIINDCYERLCC